MGRETETAYPLQWPQGRARTPWQKREPRAPFSRGSEETVERWDSSIGARRAVKIQRDKEVTVIVAIERLQQQLDLLGATLPVLSTNLQTRLNGLPRADQRNPDDPGAAIYFNLKDRRIVIACDKWARVADNIAALAAHIRATRSVERYGAASVEQAFAGYAKLPSPSDINWRSILGIPVDADVDLAYIQRRQRELAMLHHPDHGGNDAQMSEINRAVEAARRELSEDI